MDPAQTLPILLGLAVLLPLFSFVLIFLAGPKMGKGGEYAFYVATSAIVMAFVLSMTSLFIWTGTHWPGLDDVATSHSEESGEGEHHDSADGGSGHGEESHGGAHAAVVPPSYSGDWYTLGVFGPLKLTIGYYIDALTVCMFCMVTLIASCIHVYASGYMHEELHDVTDHEVTLSDGSHLTRPGRFHRFFQYLSLFCFSMLGIVIAGNIAMTFVFWELVGICSYFLIGFYVERESASTAANKAFIVNRVGDFGMIIGLMAIWTSLGTFNFGDTEVTLEDGTTETKAGLFSLVRPGDDHAIETPEGMVRLSAKAEVAKVVRAHPDWTLEQIDEEISSVHVAEWRDGPKHYGYWMLIVAGVGIFCGCVGKSAQFPLHTWLPDAMEGPTPVSALVHSATMVAAGVYLTARFFPIFVPEVLLVIASTGAITLIIGATIAITATDIKRVLAYSTISQLGYMMLSLGLGGWLAGVMHLFTHAFFKSLLFMCSGSVIHAVHTNDMTEMGGLRKKMPYTAYTMLIGCLAIAGAGIPFVIGLSGYYSKDAILEQAFSFGSKNGGWRWIYFFAAAGGAAITAFYMFRLWYMTFAGEPRNQKRYDHAHESPKAMYVPLVILSVFAVSVAWPFFDISLSNYLEQARPAGITASVPGVFLDSMIWPDEHLSHVPKIVIPVTLIAFSTALAGIALATVFYGLRILDAEDVRSQFSSIHRFLVNKWWFDELYDLIFVRPTHAVAWLTSTIDRVVLDGIAHSLAWGTRWFSNWWTRIVDTQIVDGTINLIANRTFVAGMSMRRLQTGSMRQYVMFIVLGTVALFLVVSFFWGTTHAK